jgi:sulfide:quinone oxidoreductase
VAALEAALALRQIAVDRVQVELLAPEPHFWYRPLAVAAPFELGEVLRLELDGLTREIGVGLTPGGLVGIDAWRHVAYTSRNTQLEYDLLLIACGAMPVPAVPGARTFRGPADVEVIEDLLHEISDLSITSVAFVIPWGAVYSLPAYELALLVAARRDRLGARTVDITLVTPEDEPLQVFGPPASEAIRQLLSDRGIVLRTRAFPSEVVDGTLRLIPEGVVEADRIIALARLAGPPIDGIPQTIDGFIPVDAHCGVHGVADVYAAGDITSFTLKQGGIATQQADAAAEAIAAAAGVDIEPSRFRPVLRGLLLTGERPRFLRRELAFEHELEPVASPDALWWPPAKIVGRHLAPFLASKAGGVATPEEIPSAGALGGLSVERELEPDGVAAVELGRLLPESGDDDPCVRDVMSTAPLVVAPEDTLGETAERMLQSHARAVAVTEYGRLVGILTPADLMRAAAARAHPAEARARQWMTAEPVSVSADTPVAAGAILLAQYDIDQLPVVEGDELVGMVDREQLDRAVVLSPGLGF